MGETVRSEEAVVNGQWEKSVCPENGILLGELRVQIAPNGFESGARRLWLRLVIIILSIRSRPPSCDSTAVRAPA